MKCLLSRLAAWGPAYLIFASGLQACSGDDTAKSGGPTTVGRGGGSATGSTSIGGSAGMGGGGGASGGGIPDGGCGAPSGRPFPQHVGFPGCTDCIHPNVPQATMDNDIAGFYDGWKSAMLTRVGAGAIGNEYVVRAGANGAIDGWPSGVSPVTQSEGHGYGMVIVALMAGHDPMAKAYFDSMNRVRKAFPSSSD